MNNYKIEVWSRLACLMALVCVIAASHSTVAFAQDAAPKSTKRASAKRTSEAKATKQELLLISGLQSNLDLNFEPCPENPTECIRVSNKGIVDVQYIKGKNQLAFTGLKRGETTVTIRDENGDIRLILKTIVADNNLSRRAAEIRQLLQDIEGIEIKILGDKIVIDGDVVVIGDLNRIYSVLNDAAYKDIVLNLVGVSPVGMQIMAERIQTEINMPSIKVRPFNGLFLVEGSADSRATADRAIEIAKSMLQGFVVPKFAAPDSVPVEIRRQKVVEPVIARITIADPKPKPAEKMIRLTIDFVELAKDYARVFGFSWSPSLAADGGSLSFGRSTTGGVTTEGSGSLAGTIGNLFPKLNSAQNAGYARVLEESVLLLKNNSKGEINRQTDLPVLVNTQVNSQVLTNYQSFKAGLSMKLTPRVSGQGEDVEVDVDFKYAGLGGSQNSAPIILNHGYNGSVIVKNGESAALVNMLSNTIATKFNKDPPGGSIPQTALFSLLRSKAFQKNKSQFVVFLTPQLIESSSQGTDDIKQKYGLKKRQ